MSALFRRKPRGSVIGVAQLNMKLQPVHRGEFEDAWEELAKTLDLPTIVGGGTMMDAAGEIEHSDIELEFADPTDASVAAAVEALEALGAARGSVLRLEGRAPRDVPFGVAEGLGLYLNGTDLPDDVYASTSADQLFDLLTDALGARGVVLSWWDGPAETALYAYGPSFSDMHDAIAGVLASYPLCAQSRVVQIA